MKILFLSNTHGKSYSGPSYSIPAQIKAQSNFDEVIWYNSAVSEKQAWNEYTYYHDINEIPDTSLKSIFAHVGKPDLIIIEQFYNHINYRYLYQVFKCGIPYLIIPRGQFTKQGQNRSRLKKKAANLLIGRLIIKKAKAVWYLTEQEKTDSGKRWNENTIVIPNGINMPPKTVAYGQNEIIRFVSIGRLEPYQKGLDLLINAVYELRERLRGKCRFDIYGADVDGVANALQADIKSKGLTELIEIHGPAYEDEKERVLLSSDVFIMPSRFEGHPMALIEAMSYGLPCLVSKGSNMKQEVEEARAGWVFDSELRELKDAIERCIEERDTYREYGENARNLSSKYNWLEIAKKTHDLLSILTIKG